MKKEHKQQKGKAIMSLMNLHLEKVKLPKNHKTIISEDLPLTLELKKLGFDKGSAPIFWSSIQECIQLSILQESEDNSMKLMYRIIVFTSADEFDEYEPFINNWAKGNNINGEKNFKWASWICGAFNADETLANDDNISISAPEGRKSVYISTKDLDLFDRMRTVLSSALREVASAKFKMIEQAFIDAEADIHKIEKCVKYLYEKPEELAAYPKLWLCIEKIMQTHGGVNESTILLLAAVCGVPSRGLKKEIEKLCTKYNVKQILAGDNELADALFYALQASVAGYYATQTYGYATKAAVKKVAKMLAAACEAFGFGIHPNGLVTIIRLFENDAVEGIGLDWYKSDETYNAEEFGNYDSNESEEYYNNFWAKIDLLEMIK